MARTQIEWPNFDQATVAKSAARAVLGNPATSANVASPVGKSIGIPDEIAQLETSETTTIINHLAQIRYCVAVALDGQQELLELLKTYLSQSN